MIEIFGEQNWKELFSLLDHNIVFEDMAVEREEIFNKAIKQFENETNTSLKEILNNNILLKKLIKILKENYKFSYAQIAREFNISRGKIQYFLKK